jgi:hypothetical protein
MKGEKRRLGGDCLVGGEEREDLRGGHSTPHPHSGAGDLQGRSRSSQVLPGLQATYAIQPILENGQAGREATQRGVLKAGAAAKHDADDRWTAISATRAPLGFTARAEGRCNCMESAEESGRRRAGNW